MSYEDTWFIPVFAIVLLTLMIIAEPDKQKKSTLRSGAPINRPYCGPPLEFDKMQTHEVFENDRFITATFEKPPVQVSPRVTEPPEAFSNTRNSTLGFGAATNRPYTGPPLEFDKMRIRKIAENDRYILAAFFNPLMQDEQPGL